MTFMVQDDAIEIERIETSSFGTNAYIITCRKTNKSALVDAPSQASTLINSLQRSDPEYVIITHNHMDHIDALLELTSEVKIPVGSHEADAWNLPVTPQMLLNDSDTISIGEIDFNIIHTPGHTPGSICLYFDNFLISGDTIFPGGPGKTRSPEAFQQIVDSITNKIFVLPDETNVYPGHGIPTVLGNEKKEFAVFASKPHPANLCGDVLWLSA